MKKIWKAYGSGAVLLAGIGLTAAGAAMIYLPLGLIVSGVSAIAWWILDSLDGGDAL